MYFEVLVLRVSILVHIQCDIDMANTSVSPYGIRLSVTVCPTVCQSDSGIVSKLTHISSNSHHLVGAWH